MHVRIKKQKSTEEGKGTSSLPLRTYFWWNSVLNTLSIFLLYYLCLVVKKLNTCLSKTVELLYKFVNNFWLCVFYGADKCIGLCSGIQQRYMQASID